MSHLDQRTSITCPLAQAATRLKHFFREHGNKDGDTAKLTLGINVDMAGIATPAALQRSVIVTIQPHQLPADMTPRYRVQWAPEKPGPFPLFAGELVVGGGADFDTFSLRLSGSYTPPLGLVGKGIDVAVGNRVAQSTANDLLHRIKNFIEREFEADEARKPHGLRREPT
ncbi:MAG: hypothetical protein NVSMB19_19960 [Vulcanimicrobiaceae bacterium]